MVLPDGGDVEIRTTVGVDVADGEPRGVAVGHERVVTLHAGESRHAVRSSRLQVDAHAPAADGRIGGRDVLRACNRLERLPLRKDEVEETIAVEIRNGDAGTEALGKQRGAARARLVNEVDA